MTHAQPEAVAAWIRGHWGTREPSPLSQRGRLRPGNRQPAVHRWRAAGHGRPEEPGHPASSGSSTTPRSLYSLDRQIPVETPQTIYKPTDRPTPQTDFADPLN